MMGNIAVAIDGPAGSGKSTVAKIIAKDLNLIYIDTGAMYRSVALYCIRKGADTEKEEEVIKYLPEINLDIVLEKGIQKIFIDGEDITEKIRTQEVGKGASDVGAIEKVREKMVQLQRKLSEGASVIMDGRDIGTNVLPDAQVKIYLNAGVEERAKRRCGELEDIGAEYDFESVKKQIEERDYNDMHRKFNPLMKADDAVEIDTTSLTIDEVCSKIKEIIKEKTDLR